MINTLKSFGIDLKSKLNVLGVRLSNMIIENIDIEQQHKWLEDMLVLIAIGEAF